ncbi:MAG: CopG family transcriptional regulator [Spartobacteria bacterium]|nr:CopG family transcriptional regulator [Spartobacteria bacterium]
MERRLGFIGIIIQDRHAVADDVNHLLSEHAGIIMARTGLPNTPGSCSVITLIVQASTDEVGALTGKLGRLKGVLVKSGLSKISV